MDLLHVNKNVSHMSLHYSRLNGNAPSLSQEGKMSAVAKLEGAVRGGSVQGQMSYTRPSLVFATLNL